MKVVTAKRFVTLACSICLSLIVGLSLGGKTHAAPIACGSGASCPTFSATGGDVFAGGWFSNSSNPGECASQYQNWQTVNTGLDGGILTYATEDGSGNGTGGSSSQFGAFALGSVEGNDPANYGFISGAALGGSKNQLTFANSGLSLGANAWGGQFEGSNSQLHCIPDYYDSKQNKPTPLDMSSSPLNDVNSLSDPQYSVDTGGGIFTINGGTLSQGKNLTIFVHGSVYISGSDGNGIHYDSHSAANTPKFALVVQGGDIYIDNGVSELNGWYIAQPAKGSGPGADDGVIWTCHPPGNAPVLLNTDITACTNTLTVNGALTAKHVNFTRVNNNGIGSGNPPAPAEILNYSPDTLIGGPFFNSSSSGANITSLVSLPPVY